MSNQQGGKENGEFDPKTFLYIRTNPADDGSVPLPAGLQPWLSPDISVIRPGGIRGSEGAVDEADQVEVVVTNGGGIDAVDAYVEAFVADPSTAFTPATATAVGNGFLSIGNHMQAAIRFPWTPTSADAGHRCLLARVCLSFPPDCYTNPAIFDLVGDRHVAQRNINVVKLESEMMSFGFLVVNGLDHEAAFLLRAGELRVGRNADLVRRAVGCEYAQFGQAPLAGVRLSLGEMLPALAEKGQEQAFPTGVLRSPLDLGRRKSARLDMKRGERRHAVLTVARNPHIRRGDLNVVQVMQTDIKMERTVGGLWLIVQH